jgi:DNA-binding beta-propeller fold protein YncE
LAWLLALSRDFEEFKRELIEAHRLIFVAQISRVYLLVHAPEMSDPGLGSTKKQLSANVEKKLSANAEEQLSANAEKQLSANEKEKLSGNAEEQLSVNAEEGTDLGNSGGQQRLANASGVISTSVLMAGGSTIDLGKLELSQSIRSLKIALAEQAGIAVGSQQLFVLDDQRQDVADLTLKNHDTVSQVAQYSSMSAALQLALVVGNSADEFVRSMPAKPELVIGTGKPGSDDSEFNDCWGGMAFVPARPQWLVVTDKSNGRVKIHDTNTSGTRSGFGALVCKFGEEGELEGQLKSPMDVVVTSDSALVLVVERDNNRVTVLRLSIDGEVASLVFVRCFGSLGQKDGEFSEPVGLVLRPGSSGGVETALVSHIRGHKVQEFSLDGTFIRVVIAPEEQREGGEIMRQGTSDGELSYPWSLAMLPDDELAVLEEGNHRVQIFDIKTGKYKRKFGTAGKDADGLFNYPCGLATDANGTMLVTDYGTGRIQVFNSEGKHVYTRSDLGLKNDSFGKIEWNAEAGVLAISDGASHRVCVWCLE